MHRYENMRAIEVIAVEGDKAYVRTSGLRDTAGACRWPASSLEPGQTLTQEITMIENWRFVDGDWCYLRPERDTDFFAAHPDLLKKSTEPAPAPAK